ncbi:MAG: DNA polymerase III subunit delta [Clostridia bacterium]|nr:DNA polymerase III subunit delta [Clostridia bacterium]
MSEKKTGQQKKQTAAMTPAEFSELISGSALSGGYLFYGEEDYLKNHYFSEARKKLLPLDDYFDYVCMTEDDYSPDKLAEAISSAPFPNDKKLIRLSNLRLDSFKEPQISALCEACSALETYTDTVVILVLSATDGANDVKSSQFRALGKVLKQVEFRREDPRRLSKWVARHFAGEGVFADQDACDRLISVSGRDMYTLKSETEKIAAYVRQNGRDKVGEKDIDALASRNIEFGEYDFADAILRRDGERAYAILAEYRSKKYKPELVLSGISSTVCNIYSVRLCSDSGMSQDDTASRLGLHPYRVKLYSRAASASSPSQLAKLVTICAEADDIMKNTGIDSYSVLEKLTAEAISR